MFIRFLVLVLALTTLGTQINTFAAPASYKTLSGSYGIWTTDNYGTTIDRVATADINNNLYIAVRGSDNKIYTRCSCNIQADSTYTATSWYADNVGLTYNAVAMTGFNGLLYQAVRGTDNKIYTRSSSDAINWTGWQQDSVSYTPDAVTLATFNGKMYQVARGTGDKIYTRSTTNGTTWSNWSESGGTSPSPIAMEAYNGSLVQSVRGSSDNKIYTRTSTDGTTWSVWDRDDASYTPDAVSLQTISYTSNGNIVQILFQAARGTGNKVYVRDKNQFSTDWYSWALYDDGASVNMVTPNAPTLARYRKAGDTDDHLLNYVRGPNNYIYWA